MQNTAITIEIDASCLARHSDSHLAALSHLTQANLAPPGLAHEGKYDEPLSASATGPAGGTRSAS
jgi:hypothetical protein